MLNNSTQRIDALDGFRAIAVLGVLWAHIWMFHGNPSFNIFGINVAALLSFFGTGVDLFFVISGFCMYLMYTAKPFELTLRSYFGYIKKRWLRIAPAFYVAIIIYGLVEIGFAISDFDTLYALKLASFTRNFFSERTQYAPHFWSLGTEWHFYLLLPFILIGIKKSFKSTLIISIFAGMAFRVLFWTTPDDPFRVMDNSILNRLIEFLMGIVAARLYLHPSPIRWIDSRWAILFGVGIAFSGRILMSATFHFREDYLGIFARVFDLPLLSFGYAYVIVSTLRYKTVFSLILASPVFATMGKYSYSMYLWHWIIAASISYLDLRFVGEPSFLRVNVIFFASLLILIPMSAISFYCFERFYFNRQKKMSKNLIYK